MKQGKVGDWGMELVEKTEAHVLKGRERREERKGAIRLSKTPKLWGQGGSYGLVGLLLLLLLLGLLLLLLGGGSGGGSGGGGSGTSGGDGGELLRAGGNDFLDLLALELGDNGLDAGVVTLNTDAGEDLLDILSRGAPVSTEGGEEVGSNVLHANFGCSYSTRGDRAGERNRRKSSEDARL